VEFVEHPEESAGKQFDIGGPTTYTMRELVQLAFKVAGQPDKNPWNVPSGILSFAGKLASPFNINLTSMFQMMALMDGRMQWVGEPYGSRSLEAYWEDLNIGKTIRPHVDDTRDVIVHSKSKMTREVVVTEADVKAVRYITWEFKTLEYDIGFGLQFVPSGADEPITVNEIQRVDSHLKKITGAEKITAPGKFIFIFDNTFSRMNKKSIRYLITIRGENGAVATNKNNSNNNSPRDSPQATPQASPQGQKEEKSGDSAQSSSFILVGEDDGPSQDEVPIPVREDEQPADLDPSHVPETVVW